MYTTIFSRGPFPSELRAKTGNQLHGRETRSWLTENK